MLGCHDGIPVLDLKGHDDAKVSKEGLLSDEEIKDVSLTKITVYSSDDVVYSFKPYFTNKMEGNNFNLEIENDVLTISTEQKESKEDKNRNFLRREFNYRSFKRSFELPESVDQEKIQATHEAGILTLSLPKKEEVLQKAPRQIEVK